MNRKFSPEPARRIVSGENADGKSIFVDDGTAARWLSTPAITVCDIWETQSLPIRMDAGTAVGDVVINPPRGGFIYRVTTFQPESNYTPEEFAKMVLDMGGSMDEDEHPGMHKTDTLDIVTVISGEVYCVLEAAETLLRQGDTVILRGSMHAWSNRGDVPCKVTSLMMGADRV